MNLRNELFFRHVVLSWKHQWVASVHLRADWGRLRWIVTDRVQDEWTLIFHWWSALANTLSLAQVKLIICSDDDLLLRSFNFDQLSLTRRIISPPQYTSRSFNMYRLLRADHYASCISISLLTVPHIAVIGYHGIVVTVRATRVEVDLCFHIGRSFSVGYFWWTPFTLIEHWTERLFSIT